MKLIQFIVFFQLLLVGIVIGLDQNNNSTQVDNGQRSQNNNFDNNQKNEDNNKNNNNDKDNSNKKKNEDNKDNKDNNNNEKESKSKDNKESNNKDGNKSDENKDNEKDQEDKSSNDENNDTKKNNSTNNSRLTDKDKQGISIQLVKPERLEAVQGILLAIGDTIEFEWKWAKDKKPKRAPTGFNLLAVRQVKGNIARYPIATNLSSSTFTFTLDPKSKNVTDLYESMPEANDYLLYIYDSVNGADYLGTNGTFHPFKVMMKLYRSKTPRAFSFNSASQKSSLPFMLPILGLLTVLHILL